MLEMLEKILIFSVGLVVGAIIGVVIMALINIASEADKRRKKKNDNRREVEETDARATPEH